MITDQPAEPESVAWRLQQTNSKATQRPIPIGCQNGISCQQPVSWPDEPKQHRPLQPGHASVVVLSSYCLRQSATDLDHSRSRYMCTHRQASTSVDEPKHQLDCKRSLWAPWSTSHRAHGKIWSWRNRLTSRGRFESYVLGLVLQASVQVSTSRSTSVI